MPQRIVFATNKGGTGKTTSTAICSKILAEAGYKVLAVDLDSQGNLTKMLTKESIYKYTGKTVMEAIREGNAEPYITPISFTLDLLPAEDRLAALSRFIYTSRVNNPYAVLKRLLEPVEGKYDFVLVDIGPSLGDSAINAIVYADNIIIPVDGGDFAMDALVRFMEFIEATKEEGHTKAEVLGILLTMRDRRIKYEKDVTAGIREAFGSLVFKTEIGRRARIKEMSGFGINLNDPSVDDYLSLVEEIIERTTEGGKTNDQE